jgi:translation elongation factor EF-Tu-like GTPase
MMSTPDNQVLRVRASVHLTSTEQGGRLTPIANKYMPNLKVGGIDGYAGFMLGEGVTMEPGAERVVELAMVGSPAFIAEIRPGQRFSVHEGSKEVGQGVVDVLLSGPT